MKLKLNCINIATKLQFKIENVIFFSLKNVYIFTYIHILGMS